MHLNDQSQSFQCTYYIYFPSSSLYSNYLYKYQIFQSFTMKQSIFGSSISKAFSTYFKIIFYYSTQQQKESIKVFYSCYLDIQIIYFQKSKEKSQLSLRLSSISCIVSFSISKKQNLEFNSSQMTKILLFQSYEHLQFQIYRLFYEAYLQTRFFNPLNDLSKNLQLLYLIKEQRPFYTNKSHQSKSLASQLSELHFFQIYSSSSQSSSSQIQIIFANSLLFVSYKKKLFVASYAFICENVSQKSSILQYYQLFQYDYENYGAFIVFLLVSAVDIKYYDVFSSLLSLYG
ncbi:hypothetical protein TTHERM_000384683 (macronuclear) [Tetrahymena thermophila SB210]|uniref:Uncharacterized protein n=1 Tax=Tetrahymena thermophila (strain SB210) TaxID=312017 RepID=W7XAW4_TETTS|nr:hypothetical protein TTHERM_000384683 [Tetrahymena thermophila SB210]EWS73563.1 hypothetical protein TTHERM_000384683 [Tetrahymena thermophila SB210]|eukprot:XP_012653886.1 hypothetical protein TTHERM_000384683 [Tetrahymena thermophila SB210]